MHVSLDSALGRQRRLNSVGESVLQIAPSAAAAYSLRSLTGGDPQVVRVRRDTDGGAGDNDEQDFTASEVSSGALVAFVGSGNDGFVETWYDQSGNSKNAVQATAGSQPKIVSAGALVTGGIDFDGTNDVLETSLIPPNAATLIGVASWDTASSTQLILGARDSTDKRSYLGRNSSNVSVLGNSNSTLTGGSISVETNFVLFGVHNVGKRLLSTNGTVVSNTDGGASNNTNQGYIIGALNNAGTANSFLNGKIAEVIVYASDQSDNRVAIETNINSQYSIF